MQQYLDQLKELSLLEDNWDDEGAPPLSPVCIEETKKVIEWAFENQIDIDYVDVDVCGGSAVFLGNCSGRYVWVRITNNGGVSVTFSQGGHVTLNDAKEYLKEDREEDG
jgi:hypothetical protein